MLGMILNSVSSALDFNQATLSGCIDIVCIRNPNTGELRSTPFHVRFGKYKVLRSREKIVNITVNDKPTELHMKLGAAGEAYFLCNDDLEYFHGNGARGDYSNTGDHMNTIVDNTEDHNISGDTRNNDDHHEGGYEEDEYSPLPSPRCTASPERDDTLWKMESEIHENMIQNGIYAGDDKQHIDGTTLRDMDNQKDNKYSSVENNMDNSMRTLSRYLSDNSWSSAWGLTLHQAMRKNQELRHVNKNTRDDDITTNGITDNRNTTTTSENINVNTTENINTLIDDDDQFPYVFSNSNSLKGPVTSMPLLSDLPRPMSFSLCGDLLKLGVSSEKEIINIFESNRVSWEMFNDNPSLWYNPNLVACFGERPPFYPARVALPLLASCIAFNQPLSFSAAQSILEDCEMETNGRLNSLNSTAIAPQISILPHSEDPNTCYETQVSAAIHHDDISSSSNISLSQRHRRSLRPTSAQLESLNLQYGANSITFTVTSSLQGTKSVCGKIYLWPSDAKIVVSDVDGTITRSDVLGQLMPIMGRDWSHFGVAELYTKITTSGYRILYLTARAIGQADVTRDYLFGLTQGDRDKLPEGPLMLSPDRLITSFRREVIDKKPYVFKISALRDIKTLFPENWNPFYAGFGNRETDHRAYVQVGIPESKIFLIDSAGVLRTIGNSTYARTYETMSEIADHMFPPIRIHGSENTSNDIRESDAYNSFNYWSFKLDQHYDDSGDEMVTTGHGTAQIGLNEPSRLSIPSTSKRREASRTLNYYFGAESASRASDRAVLCEESYDGDNMVEQSPSINDASNVPESTTSNPSSPKIENADATQSPIDDTCHTANSFTSIPSEPVDSNKAYNPSEVPSDLNNNANHDNAVSNEMPSPPDCNKDSNQDSCQVFNSPVEPSEKVSEDKEPGNESSKAASDMTMSPLKLPEASRGTMTRTAAYVLEEIFPPAPLFCAHRRRKPTMETKPPVPTEVVTVEKTTVNGDTPQ